MNFVQEIRNLFRSVMNLAATALKTEEVIYSDGSSGCTLHTVVSAASNNATSVKASAGNLYTIQAINKNADVRYLKFYNKASAPNPASDTPVAVFAIPGNSAGAGFTHTMKGANFSTGIAYLIVAGSSNTDNTAIAAGDVTVVIEYK